MGVFGPGWAKNPRLAVNLGAKWAQKWSFLGQNLAGFLAGPGAKNSAQFGVLTGSGPKARPKMTHFGPKMVIFGIFGQNPRLSERRSVDVR